MCKLIFAAPLLLAACADPPPIVVYQTYHGSTPQGGSVTRRLDPVFFSSDARADAYIAAEGKRVNPLDPTGRRSFDKEPLVVE